MSSRNIITFTSDFGENDGYVGIVKGAILSINSDARVIDVCHEIEPFNVLSAAWIIYNAYNYFPADSIHIVVVDPAVGSSQRRIVIKDRNCHFVGPDNGVFSYIIADPVAKRSSDEPLIAFQLTNKKFFNPIVSSSFHARDIFGPVAAHLSLGKSCSEMGDAIELQSLTMKKELVVDEITSGVAGRVVHIDRFGNLITNIPSFRIKPDWHCFLGNNRIGPLTTTYHSVEKGEMLAFAGSHGFLELAICEGNAADENNVMPGAIVRVVAP